MNLDSDDISLMQVETPEELNKILEDYLNAAGNDIIADLGGDEGSDEGSEFTNFSHIQCGENIVAEVLDEILTAVRKITKENAKKNRTHKKFHRKTPLPKSGWVDISKIIADFEIDEEIFENMIFREHLLICSSEGNLNCPTPVGGLSIDVQAARGTPIKPKDKSTRHDYANRKFLVHLSSQFDFDGHNGGSRIMAWVDRYLQTLEEKRKEYVYTDDGIDEKSLYMISHKDYYYVRHNKQEEYVYNREAAPDLITEGANFIFMRYLAIKRYMGTFEVATTYINGNICRNLYVCKGPASGIVNDRKLDVCKIYRKIIEACGIEHRSSTLLTLQGQILKHEWLDCPYLLQLNPLVDVKNEKPTTVEKIPLEKSFMSDFELLSRYLDAKTTKRKIIESYMNDNKQIKEVIADYVQSVLQLKPEDILEFTAKHFLDFVPEILPRTEYFEGPQAADVDDSNDWRYF